MYFDKDKIQTHSTLGQVIKTHENVRRKHSDSIAWQDTEVNENLQAYDSILTLDQSSAQIKLLGDINITLHENTLIVIEPLEEENPKFNFKEGMIASKIQQKSLKLGAKNWTIEAKPGTQLSLKSLIDDKLEIEVSNGEIQLSNKNTNESKTIKKDTIVKTNANQVEEQSFISEKLKWNNDKNRIYSHIFPLNLNLNWQGDAEVLEVVNQHKTIETIKVKNHSEYDFLLNPGTYSFRLKGKNGISSESFIVESLVAPVIQYFSPLPRERFKTSDIIQFNWTPLKNIKYYKLNFLENRNLEAIYKTQDVPKNSTSIKLENESSLSWQIHAVDENNYVIPPLYDYPIYSVDNPFAAPKIKEIIIRKPASKLKNDHLNKNKPTLINKLWNIIIPNAYAENIDYREVKFSWEPIEGADFYLIEISSNPNFLNPEINTPVSKNEFTWKETHRFEIYYFRIAAGDKNGRLGIFSQPQAVSLKDIRTEEIPIEKPIISAVESNNIEALEYNKKEVESIDSNRVHLTDIDIKNNLENNYIEPSFQILWSLGYAYQIQKDKIKDDFTQTFEGSVPVLTQLFSKGRLWASYIELQYVEWKIDKVMYPFQNDFEYFSGSANFYYRQSIKHAFGLHYLRRPISERISYEKINLIDKDFWGLSYLHNYSKRKWASNTFLDLSVNSEFQLLTLRNRSYFKMNESNWLLFIGIQLKGQYIQSESYSGSIVEPSIFIGSEL